MNPSSGLYGKCTACGEVFHIADLPMDMREAGKVMKRARCPICQAGSDRITVPSMREIKALKPRVAIVGDV